MECPICKGRLVRNKHPYFFGNINLGMYEADVCEKCGEAFYTEESSDKIDKEAKKMGIWGLGKEVVVGTSGNALMVRISKDIAKFTDLKKGEHVFVHPDGKNRIAIEC